MADIPTLLLVVETGPCEGRSAEVRTRQATLGRDDHCTLSLGEDATVSRRHASLGWESGAWIVRDLGSKNGTQIVSAASSTPVLAPTAIKPGDILQLGSARISVHRAAEVALPPEQLRVVRDGEALVYELHSASAAVSRWSHLASVDEVTTLRRQLLASILAGHSLGATLGGNNFLDPAARLTRTLMPLDLTERLARSPGVPLGLLLDPALLDLPWETCVVAGEYLGLSRPVTRQPLIENPFNAVASRGRRALIIANPTGDLTVAHEEAEHLLHLLSHDYGLSQMSFLAGARATIARVVAALECHDLVLYFGHAMHDDANPERSGWQLSDGVLQAHHFSRLPSLPALVIACACESARDTSNPQGLSLREENVGTAAALLLGGVEQFFGTLWPIPDVSGVTFGTVLLRGILEGSTSEQAAWQARRTLRDQYSAAADLTTGFVHYGRAGWRLPD